MPPTEEKNDHSRSVEKDSDRNDRLVLLDPKKGFLIEDSNQLCHAPRLETIV